MPRRQFVSDVGSVQAATLPHGIVDLRHGEDDGQLIFTCNDIEPHDNPRLIEITAVIPDLAEYPKNHEYMMFTDDKASANVSNALQKLGNIGSKSVRLMLEQISSILSRSRGTNSQDTLEALNHQDPGHHSEDTSERLTDDDDDDNDDDDDEPGSDPFDDEYYTMRSFQQPILASQTSCGNRPKTLNRERIRSDLMAAKAAGFRVGKLGNLAAESASYVTLSIRIEKLAISSEAMQAWQVDPSEYLILLIRYPHGYKENEKLQSYQGQSFKSRVDFRVLIGQRYKPTLQEAFSPTDPKAQHASLVAEESTIRDSFISKSLCEYMNDCLVLILRYRAAGRSWLQAENLVRAASHLSENSRDSGFRNDEDKEQPTPQRLWPNIVHADHYCEAALSQHSFPLLAMQFMLRHFVRCTEFCLVCHRYLDQDVELEALKPYVCDMPLCLYQYMSLGFGPNVEHEIATQPYVVDLLISFCYSSAHARRLKDPPNGLSLLVPPISPQTSSTIPSAVPTPHVATPNVLSPPHQERSKSDSSCEAFYDALNREVTFLGPRECRVRKGMWIVISAKVKKSTELHCRVSDSSFYPRVAIDEPISVSVRPNLGSPRFEEESESSRHESAQSHRPPRQVAVSVTLYDQDFMDFELGDKQETICKILDSLPSVLEMREFNNTHHNGLQDWTERISPTAYYLLRWIIASNRACLLQIDGQGPLARAERVYGMSGYFQFRFASGAPDKERRFMKEVKRATARLGSQCQTIFAFHGSPLYNWHMIIREGLHYNHTANGRAYGDGVYHGKSATTSLTYTGNASGGWPNSVLCVNHAMALNEIVNAPAEFRSMHPHYVVQHVDWIQTRFLFVKISSKNQNIVVGDDTQPANICRQDKSLTPVGTSGELIIPTSAIKSHHTSNFLQKSTNHAHRPRRKRARGEGNMLETTLEQNERADDSDTASMSDPDDLDFLYSESDIPPRAVDGGVPVKFSGQQSGATRLSAQKFEPGTLKIDLLPRMPLPEYANSATTTRLMKELRSIRKVQDSSDLGDLGWYIDTDNVENAYQWIAELHSFDNFQVNGKVIPLVKDMQDANVKSIVVEIRFSDDFPFSPPYVRVIRPRFIPISQGGGGHITSGGAMCMELLTNTGWSSVCSMESVLMQVRLEIASQPFARLACRGPASGKQSDYGVGEAAESYLRACQMHGWKVPPGFQKMAFAAAFTK